MGLAISEALKKKKKKMVNLSKTAAKSRGLHQPKLGDGNVKAQAYEALLLV